MTEKEPIHYQVKRSRRKSVSISVDREGGILVRAPYLTPEREIARIVENHREWIGKVTERIEKAKKSVGEAGTLSPEEIRALAEKALSVIPERVRYYAPLVGVTYGRITIRAQKTRWGSCSKKGNLNFNCLLMLAPPEVLDSVVVHELCHRKHMNHSKEFYDEVLWVFPEYRSAHKWLKDHGPELMARAGL